MKVNFRSESDAANHLWRVIQLKGVVGNFVEVTPQKTFIEFRLMFMKVLNSSLEPKFSLLTEFLDGNLRSSVFPFVQVSCSLIRRNCCSFGEYLPR